MNMLQTPAGFGERRIYYNNFAEHLQNAYNPNLFYPGLPNRWSDADWCRLVEMIAGFGYNVLEYWLVPRLFCRQGLAADYGREFTRQMNVVTDHAHRCGMKVEFICGLATVGDQWHTLCPSLPAEWAEIQYLWTQWAQRLSGTDIVGIFPGDPGACSRNGCTAQTFIDRSCDLAALIQRHLPSAEIEFHTWGAPFFGWGNLQGPANWQGEFVSDWQHTAWEFAAQRAESSMRHLLRRLPDFPRQTAVAINLGFNPDGNPVGEQDARPWAREIAKTNRILTWDFSLTEGENAIYPHYRFPRLFSQRQREREAAPYSGGICFTMTPLLNQLSLFQAARSFADPAADHVAVTREFYRRAFGPGAEELADDLPLFEIVPDWGNYFKLEISRDEFHRRLVRLVAKIEALAGQLQPSWQLHPDPETHRQELLFFAQLFADLSAGAPDYDALRQRYWQRVYAIYDQLPTHVDPRPHRSADRLVQFFRDWQTTPPLSSLPAAGEWVPRQESAG